MRCFALLLLAACSAPAPLPHAATSVPPAPAGPIALGTPPPPSPPSAASVPEPTPVDKRVDPDTLPAWPLPSTSAPAAAARTTICAVAANLDALIVAGRPRNMQLVARRIGTTVTGCVDAPSREAAQAALVALAPDPTAFAPVKLAGKGPTVDIVIAAVPFSDVVRIIGDVVHENIVYPVDARALSYDLAVQASGAAVLTRMAALAGLDEQRAGNLVYLVPHGTHVPVAPSVRKRVTVDLEAVDASAAEVVRVLSAVTPVPFHFSCTGGNKVTVRLRHVDVGAALVAVSFVSGLPIEAGDATCPLAATPTGVPPADAKLTVVAGLDLVRAAMLEVGSTRWLETARDRLDIGSDYIAFKVADGEQAHSLHRGVVDEHWWTDEPWRLSATLVSGPDGAVAIGESATGTHTLREAPELGVAIVRGAVTLVHTRQPTRHVLEHP